MHRSVRWLAALAALVFAAALAGFGAALPGYSHLGHPVGLPGGTGLPRATPFNVLAFVVPGLLAAAVAIAWRGRLGTAGWPARIGAQALLLSALAFAAQGLFPLDPQELDGYGRLHAATWTAWWLAFGVAGALLGAGLRRGPQRSTGRAFALCAATALLLALAGPALLPAGLCQRAATGLWFLALWCAARPQP